jgi:class 3 adenylate cyclase
VAELPSGTVTFLFTDLESSTRLWEEMPEAMAEALARHDEILRDAVDAHEGVFCAASMSNADASRFAHSDATPSAARLSSAESQSARPASSSQT